MTIMPDASNPSTAGATSNETKPNSHPILQILGLAAAYFVTGKLGLLLAIPPGYATAIWPPSGIALAGILILGYRAWPGILLGSFLVNVSTTFDASAPSAILLSMTLPLVIGGGAALQAVVAAFLVRRFAGFPNPLASEKEVFSFLLLGGLAGSLVNATVAVSALLASGRIPASNFSVNWGTWWVGDAMGVFVFTPLVLAWTLRPGEAWRERRMMLTVPVAVTFVLTTVVVAYGTQWERERLRLYFDQHATALASALERALNGYMGVLRSLESFHVASVHIDREEFRAFTKRYLADFDGLQALSWNPRVLAGEREEFEAATKREGLPGFQITERTAEGRLVRAGDRPEYVSVHYIEPFQGNEAALGYDVYSQSTRREALDRARDTGRPVATGRIKLVQEKGQQFGILVFLPVYRNGLPHETVEERRRNLQGYMVGVLRPGDVLEAFMKDAEEEGIVHRLLDETAPSDERLLFECEHVQDGGGFVLEEKGLFGGSARLKREVSIPFGERRWRFEILAGQKFVALHRSESAWLILVAGLLLTSLIGAFVLVVSGRGGMLRRLVAERTAALRESEGRLLAAQQIAQMGSWDWNIGNDTLSWSDEIHRIFGDEPHSFGGTYKAFLDRVHPDDRPFVEQKVEEALYEHKPYAIDHRIVLPDGTEKVVHERAEVRFDEDGKPLRMLGTVHDITERQRMEDQLRHSEERYRSVSRSVADAIIAADGEGNIVSWNPGAGAMFGYEEQEILGAPLAIIMPERYHDAHRKGLERVRRQGVETSKLLGSKVELTGRRKDGGEFPLELSLGYWKSGEEIFFSGVIRDITARKIYEQELARLKNRFEALLDSAGEGIYGVDTEGNTTFANRAALRMTGWDLDSLVGRNQHDILHHTRADGTPYPRRDCPIYAAFRDGKVHEETREVFWRKDGTSFPVEYTSTPIEEGGEIKGAVVVFRDVTKQRHAEGLSTRLGRIIEQSINEVYVFDAETLRFAMVNHGARENLGYSMDELREMTPLDLKTEFSQGSFGRLIAPLREGSQEQVVFETVHKRKDGSLYDVEVHLQLFRQERPPVFVSIIEDITGRKRVEQELQRSNAELKQFSYAVSHDLQEPLRGVVNFLTLLDRRHKASLQSDAQEYIQFAVDGAKRMSDMIRDLLEYSRVQSRTQEPEPVDTGELVRAAIDNLTAAIVEKEAEVVVGSGFPTVMGSAPQLTRVFQNLIGNGIKYRDPARPPKVSVAVAPMGEAWVFSIADNGIGIEPQYFDRIFAVFQRLHGREDYEGTGVGLALVKRIVEQHGGRIWVESEPGKGCTFFFTLLAAP